MKFTHAELAQLRTAAREMRAGTISPDVMNALALIVDQVVLDNDGGTDIAPGVRMNTGSGGNL